MIVARNYYLPLMAASGVLIGALCVKDPGLLQSAFPPFLWLIGVSLAFDLSMFNMARKVPLVPLTTNHRMMGVALGGVLFFAVTWAFIPAKPVEPAPQKTGAVTTVEFG